jgi:hypothetical protein
MSAPEPRRRWSAPVAVPADLSCLRGPTTGTVTLPHQLYWSGTGGPRTLDLTNPAERDLLYSIVLTEGTEADVCTYLDASLLRDLSPSLWLSPHVREAWGPTLAA